MARAFLQTIRSSARQGSSGQCRRAGNCLCRPCNSLGRTLGVRLRQSQGDATLSCCRCCWRCQMCTLCARALACTRKRARNCSIPPGAACVQVLIARRRAVLTKPAATCKGTATAVVALTAGASSCPDHVPEITSQAHRLGDSPAEKLVAASLAIRHRCSAVGCAWRLQKLTRAAARRWLLPCNCST